jgi:hypothetical protein
MNWVGVAEEEGISKTQEVEAMEFGNECEPSLVAGRRIHVQVNDFGCGGPSWMSASST